VLAGTNVSQIFDHSAKAAYCWGHSFPHRCILIVRHFGRLVLDYGKLTDPGGCGGIPKDRCSRQARHYLLEQIEPFRAQTVFKLHKAGGVAARPRQTIDEAGAVDRGRSRTQSAPDTKPTAQ
jgi:hypothetical protein